MLHYQPFTVNLFMENSYLLWDDSKSACIIDPGFSTSEEEEHFIRFVSDKDLRLTRCLCTHRHLDHIMGTGFIHRTWGISPEYNTIELDEMPSLESQCKGFGLPLPPNVSEAEGQPLQTEDDGLIHFGKSQIHILQTPGHTPGHVTFYCAEGDGIAFVGDVLFAGGIGRTDLWGGDYGQLMNSISEILFKQLPSATVICSGHGPQTTIAQEQKYF